MFKIIKNLLRSNSFTYKLSLKLYGLSKNIKVLFLRDDQIEITKKHKKIITSFKQITYIKELIDYFDFYFDSVKNEEDKSELSFLPNCSFVLNNFRYKSKLYFPSVPTPAATSKIYMEIAKPKKNWKILDLGSYCGVTIIDFLLEVGEDGYVLGVEPDPINYKYLSKNMNNFMKQYPNYKFDIENIAVSNHSKGIYFSSNGDMSSAALDASPILYQKKENIVKVDSINLSNLVSKYELNEVNLIKADIEGSELNALNDSDFFNNFNPIILLEPISIKGKNSLEQIIVLLQSFGYGHKLIDQQGGAAPIALFSR